MPLEMESQQLLCRCCKKQVTETDDFCPNCGFPLKGTEAEQGKFIGRYILNDSNSMGNAVNVDETTRKGGNALFVAAGFMVLGGLIIMLRDETGDGPILLLINIIVAAMYVGLGFWSKKNPFAAILVGLIIFVSLIIINAIVEPISIIQGIIVKVIVIGYLIRGLVAASKARNAI
jgi:hypothetical protein